MVIRQVRFPRISGMLTPSQQVARKVVEMHNTGRGSPYVCESGNVSKFLYEFKVYWVSKTGIQAGEDVDVEGGLISIVGRRENYLDCTLLLDSPEILKKFRKRNGEDYSSRIEREGKLVTVKSLKSKRDEVWSREFKCSREVEIEPSIDSYLF